MDRLVEVDMAIALIRKIRRDKPIRDNLMFWREFIFQVEDELEKCRDTLLHVIKRDLDRRENE